MSSIADEPMMAAPPLPVMVPEGNTYNFRLLCKSGTWKEFTCQAEDFVAARKLIDTFKEQN